MSGAKRVSAAEKAPAKKKKARGGVACAHCHALTTRIVTCEICHEAICFSHITSELVLCSAPSCITPVSCARLMPRVDIGARVCNGICHETYCRAHRNLIRAQCRRCYGFLCVNAAAGGCGLCHRCQTAPAVDKDDNNVSE